MAGKKKEEQEELSPERSIELAMAQLNREFGKGSIMKMSGEFEPWPSVSTGSFSIDTGLGIGGLPKGRLVEIYGPEGSAKSTIALQTVASAQAAGDRCLFIDAEHAMDPLYARALGVNLDELILSQPSYGEEAIDILEKMIRTGAIGVAVVDSVASMIPKAELDGDMSTQHMGLQPRLMSKAMRKIVGAAAETKTLVIFTNQIREKVGVLYGCLHGETRIPLVDGRTLPIRKIVKEKIEGEVWSFNEETGEMEPKPIIDWHHNGYVQSSEDYINIRTEAYESKSGRFGITVTPDHECLTPEGWKTAKSLSIGDQLITRYKSQFNGTLESFLRGMLCSDSYLFRRSSNTAQFVLQDTENPEYIQWKIDKLKEFYDFSIGNTVPTYRSNFSAELAIIKDEYGHRDPIPTLERLDDISLSVMIMDDGHFDPNHKRYLISFKRLKNNEEKLKTIESLFGGYGYDCKANMKSGLITFTVDTSRKIAERIVKRVPKCMEYKLPEDLRGQYIEY
ncbi:MAG: hypothetical protein LC687_06205, partial [Actinobacteria bacterium]|nr:hypothetical protein [Actinomycetota bacterium]